MEPTEQAISLAEKVRTEHGAIAQGAAFADLALYEIFNHYVSMVGRRATRAIYFTLDSTNGKRALVIRTAQALGADEQTIDLIRALGDAVSATVKHRNSSAHSFLAIETDLFGFNDVVQLVNPKLDVAQQVMTESSLEQQRSTSIAHLQKVKAAFEAVCAKIGITPTITLDNLK